MGMLKRVGPSATRREALKRGGALIAAPFVVRAGSLGAEGAAAPSDRIALGFIGIGAMGQGHLGCCLQYPDVQVAAVCDVDRWRRENAKARVDDAYAARQGAPKCRAYNDLRELLAGDDLDAVVIAAGDRWHALATVLAAQAGKDVYVEKPISLTIREARRMVVAARRYHRVVQCGLQQRTTPEFRKASDLVLSGAIGPVRIVYVGFPGTSEDVSLPADPVPEGLDWDLWLGPAPWRPFNRRFHIYGRPPHVVPWHFCRDFGGGNLTSNAVHSFDVVQWALGMDASGPVEIVPPRSDQPPLTYRYANGVLLQVAWRVPKERPFKIEAWDERTPIQNFGALYVGDRGWIHVGREGFLQSHPPDIAIQALAHAEPGRPVNNHHQDWFECIRTRRRPACDVEVGARSTTVSHLGCIAHWLARPLRWDPAKEDFIGDDEASRMRWRVARQPWVA